MREGGVIDHLWFRVADLAAAKEFYEAVGRHAGYRLNRDSPDRAQFAGLIRIVLRRRPASGPIRSTWRSRRTTTLPSRRSTPTSSAWATATTAAPGERRKYHEGYYGAFVFDPDGHNIELVNHSR